MSLVEAKPLTVGLGYCRAILIPNIPMISATLTETYVIWPDWPRSTCEVVVFLRDRVLDESLRLEPSAYSRSLELWNRASVDLPCQSSCMADQTVKCLSGIFHCICDVGQP